MHAPRIIVFAYSEVGYACLETLIQEKTNIVGVFSHEDNPTETLWYRSVPNLAKKHGLNLFQPESLKSQEWLDTIASLKPDLILSFYYRNMISPKILNMANLGAYNMHGSLLPQYRGRAPIHWAMIHGEKQTGVTLHVMVKEADAGDIIDQQSVPIDDHDDALSLSYKIRDAAVHILKRQLPLLLTGNTHKTPQNHTLATVFGGRKPEDGRIDWKKDAKDIHNLIRAVTKPFPGAFTDIGTQRLYIWKSLPVTNTTLYPAGTITSLEPFIIATGSGSLQIIDYSWVDKDSNQACPAPTIEIGQLAHSIIL